MAGWADVYGMGAVKVMRASRSQERPTQRGRERVHGTNVFDSFDCLNNVFFSYTMLM